MISRMAGLWCGLDATGRFQLVDNLNGKTKTHADESKIYLKKIEENLYTEISVTLNSGMLYL